MHLSEPTIKNWMKIDPYYQRQKFRPLTLVSGDMRFMRDIRRGSPAEKVPRGYLWRGGVKRQWVCWTLRLRHLRKWGQHYYIVLFSPLSPFHWPQNTWPWMTLTGYLALNSVFVPVWLADIARLWKIIAWKLIKIDTYCQQCKSSAGI